MPFHLSNIETSEQYIEGEHVVYCPINKSPRSSVGLIERVLTGETHAKSASPKMDKMDIHAKPEEPRYVIRNLNTGKSTAYKRYNIMRRASKEEIDSKHSNFSLDRDTSPHAEAPHHGVPIK